MTEQKFVFTIKDVKEIFAAGIRRGEDEATAFEWGSRPSGDRYTECVHAFHDIINRDTKWDEPGYVNYDVIEQWFKEK